MAFLMPRPLNIWVETSDLGFRANLNYDFGCREYSWEPSGLQFYVTWGPGTHNPGGVPARVKAGEQSEYRC